MSDYAAASDDLAAALNGSWDNTDWLTLDQKLKVAEIKALLSIAQELSALNPQNTSLRGKDGVVYNGWGMPQPD